MITAEEIRELDPDVIEQLERVVAKYGDHAEYCRQCLSIKTQEGQIAALELFPAQIKFRRLVEKLRAEKRKVRIVAVKARRVMISTEVAATFFQEVPMKDGQQAVVLAHEAEATLNIFGMYKLFQEKFRPLDGILAPPPLLKKPTEDLIEWTNKSWITCHTAGAKNYGRSFNFRYVHFSEFAFYQNQTTIFNGVMQCVPGDIDTVVVVESTANGLGDEFYRLYQRAVAGEGDFVLFFFGWHEHPLYVRALDVHPRTFEATLTQQERDLQRQHNLTLEQLNWRRFTISDNCGGSSDLFKQEYPATPEEAFLSSGRPRFNHKHLDRMRIERDAIEGRLELQELQGRKKLAFTPCVGGELTLFRRPSTEGEYVIGADTSEGIDVAEGKGQPDPDYSVADIGDRRTGEQVALYRARTEPTEFGYQLFLLGIYFNWAQICGEANGVGLAMLQKIIELSYPRDLIYHRDQTIDEDPAERSRQIGFRTTVTTRQLLITIIEDAIRESATHLRSPISVQEHRTFVIKANGRAEHQVKCHDDTVIAHALRLWGTVHMKPKKKSEFNAINGQTGRREVENYRRNQREQEQKRGELRRLI